MSKRIASKDQGSYPENASKNVERNVTPVRHFGRACNGWTKRSNDWNKTREDHGPPTVLLIKIMRALQMAAPKEKGVFAAVKRRACRPPDPVADLIARNRAQHHWEKQPFERDYAGGRKNARSYQQGITGQEETDKEPGFD